MKRKPSFMCTKDLNANGDMKIAIAQTPNHYNDGRMGDRYVPNVNREFTLVEST